MQQPKNWWRRNHWPIYASIETQLELTLSSPIGNKNKDLCYGFS